MQEATRDAQEKRVVATQAHNERANAAACEAARVTTAELVNKAVAQAETTEAATEAIRGSLEEAARRAATADVPASRVLRALGGEVACRMGDKLEDGALLQYQQASAQEVVGKQDGFKSEPFTTPAGNAFILFGRTDGVQQDGAVIETKNRKSRFLGVPLYERVQLHVYMVLTKSRRGVLLEYYHLEQRSHEVEFDDAFWDGQVLPQLKQGVDAVCDRLEQT